MDDIRLEVKGYYSLLNLHKALLEAKFNPNPVNYEVAGSPFVAQLCKEITSLLAQHDLQKKGYETWTEWLQLKNRPDYRKCVLQRMLSCTNWEKMCMDEKRICTLNYLSPFTCMPDELDDLISEFDVLFYKKERRTE